MNCTGYPSWADEPFACPFDYKCEGCDYDCEVNTNAE